MIEIDFGGVFVPASEAAQTPPIGQNIQGQHFLWSGLPWVTLSEDRTKVLIDEDMALQVHGVEIVVDPVSGDLAIKDWTSQD